MRREELLDAARLALLTPQKDAEHRRHPARIVAGAVHQRDAELVGFSFIVAAETRESGTGDDLRGDLLDCSRILPEEETGKHADPVLTRDLFGGVTGDDVTDLVSHDAGQLRGVLRRRDQPGIHVNVATGNRESVDRRILDDVKVPGELIEWSGRSGHDLLADVAHVRVDLGIVVEPDLLGDVLRELLPELPLLVDGNEIEIAAAARTTTRGEAGCEHDGDRRGSSVRFHALELCKTNSQPPEAIAGAPCFRSGMSRRVLALLFLLALSVPLYVPAHAATRWLTDRGGAPIQWQDWGTAAIERSRKEGRPIFLCIGSAASNRAYRMHREAFLNGEIAEAMNAYFVPVLLDPIEHPEIAEAYATVLRAMKIEEGPPSNLILTSSLEPFAAAGFLKPDELNRMLVIQANRWAKERAAVVAEAHVNIEKARELGEKRMPAPVDAKTIDAVVEDIAKKYGATKTLDAMTISFLFDYAARVKNENIRGVAEQTLRDMAILPIRDQLGGGFHRTGAAFEKTLPDQALLAMAYLDAWQIDRDPDMSFVARTTLDYVVRDLRPPRGGAFDSAQDAHNLVPGQGPEFVNGAFYLWTTDEILHLLGRDTGSKIVTLYGMKEGGVLNRPELKEIRFLRETYGPLAEPLAKMLDVRLKRPAPFRESTIVAGWNGLMISALARGSAILDEPRYLEAANLAATYVAAKLWKAPSKTLMRTDGGAPALAEDYALLEQGLLDLFDSGYDPKWLDLAVALQQRQDTLFWDASSGRYATGATLPDALRGLLNETDADTPDVNSVAASNLLRLAALTGNQAWRARVDMIFQSFGGRLRATGAQLPQLAAAYEASLIAPTIVVVTGDPRKKETVELLHSIHDRREPMRAVVFLPAKGPARDRVVKSLPFTGALTPDPERTIAYVCANGECRKQ